MLEAAQHRSNAFVTLTYDDMHLPKDGCVHPRVMQLFIKGLRNRGYSFRYYAVGEYGERSNRPHYHVALFNFPQCHRGQTDLTKAVCCRVCTDVALAWKRMGACQVAFLEPASAAYIAGYVTKKITRGPLPKQLSPEFQRVSLRPGLGYSAMYDVANVLLSHNLEEDLEDVPTSLQHGPVKQPLGRYLRQNLRKMLGRDEKCPPQVLEKLASEVQDVRQAAFDNSESFAGALVKANIGAVRNLETKIKLKTARGNF